jgi:hypothetical protein
MRYIFFFCFDDDVKKMKKNFSLRVVDFWGKKTHANNNQRAIKKDVASSGQTGEEDFPLLLLLLLLLLFLRLE